MNNQNITLLRKQIAMLQAENQELKEKLNNGLFVSEKQIEEYSQSQSLLNETNKIARVGGWELNLNTNKLFYTDEIFNIIEAEQHFTPSLERAFTFYIPEHKKVLAKAIEQCIQEQKSFELELQILTEKKNSKWVNVCGKPECDEQGNTTKIIGTFQDINKEVLERQKIDLILQASEDFIGNIHNEVSYQELADTMLKLSDGEIVSFNLYQPETRNFKTVAVSIKNQHKTSEYIKINKLNILSQLWNHDRFSELKRGEETTTIFKNMDELAGHIITAEDIRSIETTFDLGEAHLVKIKRRHLIIGDFTILYPQKLKPNTRITALFANQTGLYIENKQVAEHLIHSEQKHKQMIAGIWDVIAIVDLKGFCSFVTPNITSHFGWQIDEVLHKNVIDFVHPDDHHELNKHFFKMLRGEVSSKLIDLRYRHHDGSYRNIEISATNHIRNSAINGILINFHDITKRKSAETQSHKLEQAIEHSSVSIVITDINGIIEYINPRFTDTSGYSREEVIGKNPRILQSGKTTLHTYENLWNTILSGKEWNGVLLNKKKNGNLYWEKTSISSIIDQYGKITHFVGIKEDISKQIKNEKELRHTNKKLKKINAEKDRFFSIIAHDLRSPFNTFMGITSLIANEMHNLNEDQLHGLTQSLDKSAHNMYDLLSNLLDWSMVQRGTGSFTPETVNLFEKTEKSKENLFETAKKKNISIINNIPENTKVIADRYMLGTILRNLITNAIKFTHEGGTIALNARLSANNDQDVVVSVTDTGIGMSKSIQKDLFKISKSVKREGTQNEPSSGLGLILCKDFIKKHGGKIWVESTEGKGSTFYFTLPTI